MPVAMSSATSPVPPAAPALRPAPAVVDRWARIRDRVPFLTVALLVLALWIIKEFFPFSHFPMYSGMDTNPDYYFVTDANGEELPMLSLFNTRTARAKKVLRNELTRIAREGGRKREQATTAEREQAGRYLLHYLWDEARPEQHQLLKTDALEIQWVVLGIRDGRITQTFQTIARVPVADLREGAKP